MIAGAPIARLRVVLSPRFRITTSTFCYAAVVSVVCLLFAHRWEHVELATRRVQHYMHRRPYDQLNIPNISWVEDGPMSQANFPAPYLNHRYTHFHAAVRSQQDTYRDGTTGRFVSVLANIDCT